MSTNESASVRPHPIEGLMTTAMENIKQMVDVNTVVGDAVEANDGTVIIPLSQVSFGFAAGGGEYEVLEGKGRETMPFAGGSGGGVSIKPIGFLVVRPNSEVRLLSVKSNQLALRLMDLAPEVLNRIETMLNRKDGQVPPS